MEFLQNFSKVLSNLTGISEIYILLVTYSIIAIIIIDLLAKGITFLNTNLNKNDKIYIYSTKKSI